VAEAVLDHIPGGNLLDPVLEELVKEPGGFLKTTELMARLRARFQLSGAEAALIEEGADAVFNEQVMRLVTLAWQDAGASGQGLARFQEDRHGWHINPEGRDFVTGVT
jgi:hypothetical protein